MSSASDESAKEQKRIEERGTLTFGETTFSKENVQMVKKSF